MIRGTLMGVRCAFALAVVAVVAGADDSMADVGGDRALSVSPPRAAVEVEEGARSNAEVELGEYEREALRQALEALDLRVVDDPEGRTIRRVHVVNLEVFGEEAGWIAWLNTLRRTTRDEVIAREVLVGPKDAWDAEKIAETRRNLADPTYSSLVVIRPVRPAEEGNPGPAIAEDEVDLLIVTRDVWSLRLSTLFEMQQDVLSSLSVALIETNFLGLRKVAAVQFDLDLGSYAMGPLYIDPNIAGTRLELAGRASAVFNRETGSPEGSRSAVRVAYPLWSLDRRWGASLSFSHDDSIARSFEGGGLRQYEAPGGPIPWEYDRRELGLVSEVVRSQGVGILHRVGFGHELELSRPAVLDSFAGDEAQREVFERDVLPRSERASSIFARYRLFEPRYEMYRDLDTFDLREERRLGPDLQLKLSFASPALGSESTFWRGRARLAWSLGLGEDGIANAALEGDSRLQGGELIDNELRGVLTMASPRLFDLGRIVARADVAARVRERSNRFYTLGGMTGLRGYPIGHDTGTRRARLNVEARSAGLPVWLFRAGAVAFWDAGHAADRAGDLSLRHDVGAGIRFLAPQFSRFVVRIDWAIPLHGADAGLPGRITAGGGQVF